jgi:thiol-disulfide isomerase/thioredoxin
MYSPERDWLPALLTMTKIVNALFVIIVVISLSSVSAAQQDELSALYFFSANCGQCKSVEPAVKELSREFTVQGLLYGKDDPGPMPFDVRKGDKKTSVRYGIEGVPTLVVLKNGSVKLVIRGEDDIRDAQALLRAFRKGAMTVSEAIEQGPQKACTVAGWIVSRGEYFRNGRFSLTDRKQAIAVKPWLPVESIKSPFRKTRPRLMSDVINKPVLLEGTLTKINDDLQFTVRKEIILE